MNSALPTVFVVDDDVSVLKGLGRLIAGAGLNVATFNSPQQFLDRHDPDAPGCLVLDVEMPGFTGIELQRALAERGSILPIIFLTGHGDVPTGIQAMKHGAVDFLTKPADANDLLAAIGQAFDRDRALRRERGDLVEVRGRLATLTPREREVLAYIVSGRRNKEIAADLGTVEKTIKVHRGRVMKKLQVRSLAELVRLAERANVERPSYRSEGAVPKGTSG